jgi:hypothetical protein
MKFEVGEIAITVVDLCRTTGDEIWSAGIEVEVTEQRPSSSIFDADYRVKLPNGEAALVMEMDLRKRHPPETPAEDQFQHDLGRWLGWKDRECIPLTPAQKAYVKQYGDIQPK